MSGEPMDARDDGQRRVQLASGVPAPGECLADNSTLGYVRDLVYRTHVDAYGLMNLNQLCKQVVLFEHAWTWRPHRELEASIAPLREAFRFIEHDDVLRGSLKETFSTAVSAAKGKTKADMREPKVHRLWSIVLSKPIQLDEWDIDSYVPSPLYYHDGQPDDIENPHPKRTDLELPPERFYAAAASFRSNLYLEFASFFQIPYVPDTLRSPYVNLRLSEEIEWAFGFFGATEVLRRVAEAISKKNRLRTRHLPLSTEVDPTWLNIDLPILLLYVLDHTSAAEDILGKLKEIRDSGPAKRLRQELSRVDAGYGSVEGLQSLLASVSDLVEEWSTPRTNRLRRAASIVSIRPLPLVALLFADRSELARVIEAGLSAAAIGVTALQVLMAIDRLRNSRKFALLEKLVSSRGHWFSPSPLNFLKSKVRDLWKVDLRPEDLEFMSRTAPLTLDIRAA